MSRSRGELVTAICGEQLGLMRCVDGGGKCGAAPPRQINAGSVPSGEEHRDYLARDGLHSWWPLQPNFTSTDRATTQSVPHKATWMHLSGMLCCQSKHWSCWAFHVLRPSAPPVVPSPLAAEAIRRHMRQILTLATLQLGI